MAGLVGLGEAGEERMGGRRTGGGGRKEIRKGLFVNCFDLGHDFGGDDDGTRGEEGSQVG